MALSPFCLVCLLIPHLATQGYLKVHNGLVSEDVLEDSRVADLNPIEKCLVGFEHQQPKSLIKKELKNSETAVIIKSDILFNLDKLESCVELFSMGVQSF